MTKRNKIIIGVALLLALVLGGVQYSQSLIGNSDIKEVTINIYVLDELKESIVLETQEATLADLLDTSSQLNVESIMGDYGYYLQGLGIDEVFMEDPTSNIYWVYESSNNEGCVSAGYCDAANIVALADGDVFDFKLTDFSNGY
ncbi:MAG: hypothetical protein R3Y57_04705 [Erysipelotrichaceae bacterium]